MINSNKGFTLIELLIVIGLIGILASIILVSVNSARGKARDTERVSNVKQVERALLMYHLDNGSYPISPSGDWAGNASSWGSHSDTGPTGYIPNLAPTYIPRLPIDPKQENNKGYIYKSDGTDYFFLAYKTLEKLIPPDIFKRPSNPESNDLAIYTPGFANEEVPGEDELDGQGDEGGEEISGPPSTPVANPTPGLYLSGQSVSLSSDPGSSIYYVLSTSSNPPDPTSSSSLYSSPIVLTSPNLTIYYLKAIAIKGGVSSGVLSFGSSYIITAASMPE